MKCTIIFKSGKSVDLDVLDCNAFVISIIDGVKKSPNSPNQWYQEPGILLNVSDVAFICPAGAIDVGQQFWDRSEKAT